MNDPYKALKNSNTFWEALGPDSLANGPTYSIRAILDEEQEILLALMQSKDDAAFGRRIRERAEVYAEAKRRG
jgi:hypothetical protein